MSKLLFSPEFLASGYSHEFREFLSRIIQAKSKAEEKNQVEEELIHLSSKLGSSDPSTSKKMKEYLTRLIHCFMLGYSVDFSIIYAIMTTQSGESALDKRIGYLACTLFLQKNNELCIMLINTLQKDLQSQSYLDQSAALNAVCYLYHPEIPESVVDLVLKTMQVPKQVVHRIEPSLRQALNDQDHSVAFSALSVWKMILRKDFRDDILPAVCRINRQIIERRVHKSFNYHGVLAPWAQLDCLAIYEIYIRHNTHNESILMEIHQIIKECLNSILRKVDAAFAILLECTKLLGLLNTQEDTFDYLDSFLEASNHNLKYLGLLCLSFIDRDLWKEDWQKLLGKVILDSIDDDTVIQKTLELLDSVMSLGVLKNVSTDVLKAISKSDEKEMNELVGHWLIQCVNDYHIDVDEWYIDTMLYALAETRKYLDQTFVESQCQIIKTLLDEELIETKLKEMMVDLLYKLLKKSNTNVYSSSFTKLAFSVLGEYGYLSDQYTEIDFMNQLQKWVLLLEGDDDLQLIGLLAIKKCILRSKTWLSSLQPILKECQKSSVPEKQELYQELIQIINDDSFKKEIQESTVNLAQTLSINPNRPTTTIGRFSNYGNPVPKQYPRGIFNSNHNNPATAAAMTSVHKKTRLEGRHNAEENLVSSLINMDLQDRLLMTTKEFGELWVTFEIEEKRKMPCFINECETLAQELSTSWDIQIVQVIGREFIAFHTFDVLIHVALFQHEFELTIRTRNNKE
ncbi:hypothetical protein G6F43_011497 [Rhizopus delemar]|nr:hypothetical protein G6F43_011497 [Rhizopus delemar]